MKISKFVLMDSYYVDEKHFFENRNDRNTYFANFPTELDVGVKCAIGANPQTTGLYEEVWDMEIYNGANWTVQTLDPNYSLVITTDGLNALANIAKGTYNLEISAIKIKQNHIVKPSKPIMSWSKEDFEADGDIILNTESNQNFTLENNLRWRTNMANGGIQYTILIETDTYGEKNGIRYDEYTIGAIGLYINDPNEPARKVLFAIGNLNSNVPKYTSTVERVGNAIKLLLNTVISNLGYVSDVTLFKESVNSIAEVENEVKLQENYGSTISPYNLYLVNNYAGTNIPALAARKGDPTKGNVEWQYFTPKDDVLTVDETKIDSSLLDYMVATWDKNLGKFVRAEARSGSLSTLNVTGIKVGNNIIFSGNVACFNTGETYKISVAKAGAGYRPGDLLVYTNPSPALEFKVRVKSIDINGGVDEFTLVSVTGIGNVSIAEAVFGYDSSTASGSATGKGFAANISSSEAPIKTYLWDFPGGEEVGDKKNWYNLPLYADKNWSSASDQDWADYCNRVGLSTSESRDRRGKLTIEESDFFIGWCTGVASKSSIQLQMDLEDQASETDYGTTRYASNTEVKEKTEAVSTVTAITPQTAFDNYIQRSKPSRGAGSAWDNRITVDSYVQYNTTLVGKLPEDKAPTQAIMNNANISFYGTAYRALWGDLAEYYRSDKVYPAGTLVTIGCGSAEITKAITECNGIVSTRPGYELGEKTDQKDLPVALVGKVPVIFDGKCSPKFGDRVYLSQTEPGKASTRAYGRCLGKIIDKGQDLGSQGTVLCSVRISF